MKTSLKVALALLVPVALAAGGYLRFQKIKADREYHRLHDPISMPERVARVPERWDAATLATHLEESGKVREASVFQQEAEQIGLSDVEPGGYVLPRRASPLELARIFKAAPPLRKVTFPEGYTVGQIATVLEKADFADGANLRRIAYPSGGAPSPLEGKLFPDTYLLPHRASARQLAQKMMGRWLEIVRTLPRPFPVVNGKRLTLSQVTVLASLVEREAANDAERPLVASALLNRLRKPMRLQCDASVLYGMRRAALAAGMPLPTVVSRADYQTPSPFNTYTNDGLPPGAICNPGAASLRAAAHPATSPYLFYVLSPSLGKHRFAATFEEHQHNIALARQERAQ